MRAKKIIKAKVGRACGVSGIYSSKFRSIMTIVAFHRVSDTMLADGITCDVRTFARFCRFFSRYFDVIPLSKQIEGIRSGRPMGGTLSITFDDGYRDNYENAAPILRSAGLPATFFVATKFIGSNVVPPWDAHLPTHPGWMTWDQIVELASQGFEIGCHTDTHIDMGSSDEDTIRAELTVSKSRLEDVLSRPVDLFAYPFGGAGNITEAGRDLVREAGFECCASCFGGTNEPLADPFRLKRIGIAGWFESPDQFGLELLLGRA